MAITATAYGPAGLHLARGEIDLESDTLKVTLHTSTYAPNGDHEFFDAVTNEAAGTGYTAGGETLTTVALAYDTGNGWTAMTADDTEWVSPTTLVYRYAVVRKDTGSDATSPLIFWVDFGSDQSVAASNILLDWADLLRLVA